jgi:hypothetical protein
VTCTQLVAVLSSLAEHSTGQHITLSHVYNIRLNGNQAFASHPVSMPCCLVDAVGVAGRVLWMLQLSQRDSEGSLTSHSKAVDSPGFFIHANPGIC